MGFNSAFKELTVKGRSDMWRKSLTS